MHIDVYRVTGLGDVPERLFSALDMLDDRFLAAFENYPSTEKLVVAGWATTGEIAGEPIGALVATLGHIITGYVDNLPRKTPNDDEFGPPLEHDEPTPQRMRAALLARLRNVSNATWLLIHDADEISGWRRHGFRLVKPPTNLPADKALLVLAWGELPEEPAALLQARGLSWHLEQHRYPSRYQQHADEQTA